MSSVMNAKTDYQTYLDNAIRLTGVINEMIAGNSITKACQKMDVKPQVVECFFSLPLRNNEPKKVRMPDWKSDFIKNVYGEDSVVLSDFDECYAYFKSTLTTDLAKVLVGRFEKKLSYTDIAMELGVSGTYVRKLLRDVEDLLHTKDVAEMFQLGGEYSTLVREVRMAQFTHDQTVEKLKETLMKLDAETKGIEDSIEIATELRKKMNETENGKDKITLADITIGQIQIGKYAPLTIDARTVNVCQRCRIQSVEDLFDAGGKRILRARGAGKKVVETCCGILNFFGLPTDEWMVR